MRTFLVAAMLLLLSGSAFAQTAVYDPDGKLVTIPNDTVDTAIANGYRLASDPKAAADEERVNVITPEGDLGSLPRKSLAYALQNGWRIADEVSVQRASERAADEAESSERNRNIVIVIGLVAALFAGAIVAVKISGRSRS